MASDNFEVLKGIYARLDRQLLTDVYSFVPQNASYPYVSIGPLTGVSVDDKTNDRIEYTCQIHTWDKNVSSFQTVMDIMDAIRLAMHKQEINITVTGYVVSLSRIEFSQIMQEGNSGVGGDHYFHGVQRLRFIVDFLELVVTQDPLTRITESGDRRITEDGNIRITEGV